MPPQYWTHFPRPRRDCPVCLRNIAETGTGELWSHRCIPRTSKPYESSGSAAGDISKLFLKWKTYYRRVRHLSEDDCWAQPDGSFMGEPAPLRGEQLAVEDTASKPDRCEHCGSEALCWNGRFWFCDSCDKSTVVLLHFYIPAEAETGKCYAVQTPKGPDQYAEETAWFRVPASLNWPHGRIRPKLDRSREGIPRSFDAGPRKGGRYKLA